MKFPKLGLFVVIAICMSLTFACGDDDDGGGMMAGVENQITSGAMPPASTAGPAELTDAEMDIFLCWIEGGALDN